jgi:microcystin degradation protein MlrC
MKVFAAGIGTETNTFSPFPTRLADFARHRGGSGGCLVFDLREIWGRRAVQRGYELVEGLMAWAQPFGITERSAYEELRAQLIADLRAALPVDVVLLMLHGAMIAERYDDYEQDLISEARRVVGEKVVIGVEFDLHCPHCPRKLSGFSFTRSSLLDNRQLLSHNEISISTLGHQP